MPAHSAHSTQIVPLTQITYSQEEQNKIFDYFRELKTDYIRTFLTQKNLHRSGPKNQLIVEIREHIDDGTIQFSDLVNFLDAVIPFSKQHVFLYDGPEHEVVNWRLPEYCRQVLTQNDRLQYLNQKLHLILPFELTLSSIEYNPGRELKILAVQRRDYIERCEEFDTSHDVNGDSIEMHAYKHQVLRGLIIFNWNLISNQARLQITQLPSRGSYEDGELDFGRLIQTWLPFNLFQKLNLRPSITQLRNLEAGGTAEVRSQDISLETLGGRRVSIKSPTSQDSTIGEEILDQAVQHVSDIGIAHLGNFYWLPRDVNSIPGNILDEEVHTIIVGNRGRINFTTPNRREDFEYVLSRVRSMC